MDESGLFSISQAEFYIKITKLNLIDLFPTNC